MKQLFALLSGLVFGIGLIVSGMADPAKVLNFLDVFGTWDPSLAFVMGGAIAVTAPGFAWLFRSRQTPYLGLGRLLPRPCVDRPADGGQWHVDLCPLHAGRHVDRPPHP